MITQLTPLYYSYKLLTLFIFFSYTSVVDSSVNTFSKVRSTLKVKLILSLKATFSQATFGFAVLTPVLMLLSFIFLALDSVEVSFGSI